jgi:D-glycero-alpha-D-manno-heptose-7-phosphate kinase
LLKEQSANVAIESGAQAKATDHLVRLTEAAYGELCAGHIEAIGPMLNEAWQFKRQVAPGVTNSAIDDAYAAAIAAGAEGGKILGAGGGGFLMFFAPQERHGAIRAALSSLREVPFNFASHGSNIIFVH